MDTDYIHPDYMYVPRCKDCKERPDVTQEGTFYCPMVGDMVDDDNEICEYFNQG